MKKSLISILAILLIESCQVDELAPEYVPHDDDLYASIESLEATKTVMDENNNVLCSAVDADLPEFLSRWWEGVNFL